MSLQDMIWTSLPTPVLILDEEDRISAINPAAESFLMSSSKAVAGQPVWDRLSVDAPLEEAFRRARAHDAPLFVNDVDVSTGHGVPVQCNLHIAPLAGQSGQMILHIAPRELAGRMSQRLSVGRAAKSAIGMAEMLAHEIKNPLAGITGAAQLLSMTLEAEDQELTDLIVSECRRIVALLDQVEQFGNVSQPRLRPINLHDVLDRARKSAGLGFAAQMTIEELYDPSLPLALGDADQLLQVILNLLKNAAEAAGPTGGTIQLRSYYEPSLRVHRDGAPDQALPLQIEVVDDGPGLPPDIQAEVFEPFVSGRDNGTGLGLALAAKIMNDHGGWISISSVPGRTVVKLSLPRADDASANHKKEVS
ncbi:PAS domain-containing protein [Roseovarius faecimaris]|uniref:histidine kinase n=1 Tax=Roseovarius faecimaris TaxID=2494550 RepID=A0A6I6IQT6_9RHOB|nr:ATP-binding protein [Roseovarius faecimaris]QGX98444.1 PAS domain-containing protein [Roseovarius faecimaris]